MRALRLAGYERRRRVWWVQWDCTPSRSSRQQTPTKQNEVAVCILQAGLSSERKFSAKHEIRTGSPSQAIS